MMVVLFPTIILASASQLLLISGSTEKNKKRLEKSGRTAVESIRNIRTVVSLRAQTTFFKRFSELLAGCFK